jgi:SAM-dependent methyltransferase
MNDTPADTAALVAEHWTRKLESTGDFSADVYWLAVPRVVRYYMEGATRGRREDSWVNDCVFQHLAGRTPVERMLSIGCGRGELERHLSLFPAFLDCDAWDLSESAVDTARRLAEQENRHNIHYAVRDANTAEIAPARYDAIWFNNSLHHIEALERVCENVAGGLKPGGWLFLNEYVGPNRFDMPLRQKEAIRAAFALIPRRLRRHRGQDGGTEIAEIPAIPCPAETVAADPSEAVRSADILGVVGHYFDIVEQNPAGGTILQFLLHGIAGNFQPEDQESMEVLDTLLRIERSLIRAGDLASDFAVVAARRRARPASPILACHLPTGRNSGGTLL